MGAKIFEKHVALQNQKKGFDIKFSLKGKEIKFFIKNIQLAWQMTRANKFIVSKSQKLMKKYRRSIFVVKNIKKGEKFSNENIKSIRPGYGVSPAYYEKMLNKRSPQNIKTGQPLRYNVVKKVI